MDVNILGGLVKRIYPDFNMDSFENRLKIQKMVFIMRAFKLDLGYYFQLYMKGPYCANLTRDAFQITNWKEIKPVEFQNEGDEKNFSNFMRFYESKKNKTTWLELASTILLLKEINKTMNDDSIINLCTDIKNFDTQEIKTVFNDLKNEGLA